MTADQIDTDDTIFVHETEALESLRHRGFAVIVWTPGELRSASRRHVEDRSVELGWDIINCLQQSEED